VRNIVNKTKASKKRFKTLFKGIPIPTYSWQKIDDDFILIDYNDAAEKITKGMIKNYVDTKASEMYKNQPEILEEFYRCANDHVSIFREMKYSLKSTGEEKFLSVMYGFIPPDLVLVHTEDITEKKEALERLKKSEKELKALTLELKQRIGISEVKYRTIFENTGTATVMIEEDTTISLVNGQFEELSGYSREEIEWKKSWIEFVIEEDLERMKKIHNSRRKDPESIIKKYEFCFVNKEGTIRDILLVADVIPGTKKSVASLLDITDRKKAEEKIRKSKEFIAEITSNIPGLIFQYELNTKGKEKFNFISDGIKTLMEVEPEAILADSKAIWNTYLEEYLPVIMEKIKESEEKLIPWHVEYQLRTAKTSTIKWVEGLSIPKQFPNGNIVWNGWVRDITKRKKAEENLKESEKKFKTLSNELELILDHIPALVFYKDTKNNFIRVNQYFADSYNLNKEEIKGTSCFDLFTKEQAQACWDYDLEVISSGKPKLNVEELWDIDDGLSWVLTSKIPYYDEKGEIKGIIGMSIDITESKKLEEELRESEEKFRYLFNNAQVGLYWSGISDGKILECNDTFAKLFGYNTREDCLANYNTIEHYIDPNARSEILEEIRDNKEVKNYEIHVTKKDGTPIWVNISARMFEKEDRIEGAAIDITERKIAEEKILESEEKYREAYNRAEFYKDLFAHDINNILQSILSGIQINQLIVDNPEKHDSLKINSEIIKEQVNRGAKLISNVRKLSKLEETGRNLEKIEILNVLKNTVSFVKKSYKDKNLTIRIDSIGENLFIIANNLLEDVFENLLINAIRHNQNLIIEITVRISREQKVGINYLKIEFIDNGFGVADSMKEKIFQRGYSKEKGVYGMGLGLSLVRGIIETYNAKIWVEDRVKGDRSKGSNFVLLIPEVD
jgi:PAS domain S-box-containing protein